MNKKHKLRSDEKTKKKLKRLHRKFIQLVS